MDVPPGPQLEGMEDPDSVTERFPGFDELEVESLPDLDVIILRGRDQDVKQLTQIIRELEATQQTVWSPMILNGSGFGLVANHSLSMASYISRANAAVIDLRALLQQG